MGFMIVIKTENEARAYGPFGEITANEYTQRLHKQVRLVHERYGDAAFVDGEPHISMMPSAVFTNVTDMLKFTWENPVKIALADTIPDGVHPSA